MRVNLKVPEHDHDAARAAGAQWDAGKKVWYMRNPAKLADLMRWITPGAMQNIVSRSPEGKQAAKRGGKATQQQGHTLKAGRTYLKVPKAEKERAKRAGVRWDADACRWYAPEGVELSRFDRWLDLADLHAQHAAELAKVEPVAVAPVKAVPVKAAPVKNKAAASHLRAIAGH